MIHRTRIEDAEVDRSGWYGLDADTEVTRVPLVDSGARLNDGTKLFARLTYRDALAVAGRLGARLIDRHELELVRQVATIIEPYPLTADARMTSLEWSERHDIEVWRRIRAAGWTGGLPVLGAGKHWIAGAPRGRAHLMGWWTEHLERYGARRGAGWVQQPSPVGGAGPHDEHHHDYATTTMLVRSRGGHGDAPAGPGLVSLLAGAAGRILAPLRALGGHLLGPRPLSLGEALLEEALKDLGVKEVGGANRGPEVDAYNRGCGVPMGSPWCASSLTAWLRRASLRLKRAAPIIGSAGAKRIMFELQKAGRWFTAEEIRLNPSLLRPGMIHCWDRGGEKGHVGVHRKVRDAQAFDTVEGNSGTGPFGEGNRVAEMVRRFDDPRWLGAGWVD